MATDGTPGRPGRQVAGQAGHPPGSPTRTTGTWAGRWRPGSEPGDRLIGGVPPPVGGRALLATTRLRIVPTFSTVTSIRSPGSIHAGGVRAKPTPPGVPVAMTSPGARWVKEEKNSTAAGTL